ncbi:MAG: hypothetical protein R6U37_03150 [Dehalococcoidia bacterium]
MALYDEVIDVARSYLGPAATKFVNRQVRAHLEIDGSQLTYSDIDELAEWCYTSSKVLMDEMKAREFSEQIRALRNGTRV